MTGTITVHKDSGVWRATLGESPETGLSSVARDPYATVALTLTKAREAGWVWPDPDAPHADKPAVTVHPAT
jgi:hypothetical protein